MDRPARYCEYCGKPLNEKARFCGRCGKPVDLGEGEQASPPAKAAQPTQPPPDMRQRQAIPPRPSEPLPAVQKAAPSRQVGPPAPAQRPAQPPPAQQPKRSVQAGPARPIQPPLARPVQPMPPYQAAQAPQAGAAPPEAVCGVIPGAFQRKGAFGLGQQSYALVLTNYRVIFAMQTNQMIQEQVRYARSEAKQEGKGFFGQWGAQLSASVTYYQQKQPEAILAEQPGNFFIPHNQLRAVKFHVIHNSDHSQSEYQMEFDAVTGKVGVLFNMIDQKKAQQALKQVLGDRVHWSHGFFS